MTHFPATLQVTMLSKFMKKRKEFLQKTRQPLCNSSVELLIFFDRTPGFGEYLIEDNEWPGLGAELELGRPFVN